MSIDHHEVRELALQLHAVPGDIKPLVRRAIDKTADDVVAGAQAAAPVDTGNLRSSIGSDQRATGGLAFTAGPTADYGHYVEYGTSRMAPQPYMGPAFDRGVEAFVSALGSIGRGALG